MNEAKAQTACERLEDFIRHANERIQSIDAALKTIEALAIGKIETMRLEKGDLVVVTHPQGMSPNPGFLEWFQRQLNARGATFAVFGAGMTFEIIRGEIVKVNPS